MGPAYLTGLGTSFPGPPLEQQAIWDGYFAARCSDDPVARRIFAAVGVDRRHAAVNPLVEDVSGWSTGERMRRWAAESVPLGKDATSGALAGAGLPASELGLLTVVSCTGYATPGLDIRVAADLGLAAGAQRLSVGHMGCYAAIPGLGAAADFVTARGRPAAMLCCELTSLHVQPPDDDRGQAVSHALFGDAAASVVLRPDPVDGALEVLDVAAVTDPATSGHMTWEVTDLGFRMGLSPEVPDVLARHVGPAVTGLLERHGLTVADVDAWAVHPGGPRILDVVADRLGLGPEHTAASRAVLANRGNCSSATVILVLDALRSAGRPRPGRAAMMLAFGPGLTLYAALLRAV
ncbi:MAG: type III polyketide synthase [Actinomycetota bacterium]|nr:type III polyketide synthase [Actinomycetota bacterium]